jgi:phenylacetic acid degradation operon negative regulatory protein
VSKPRNTRYPPLTARSVVASTLLGMRPPRLPGRILVRSGELFGIAEGTTRVALSRMQGAGELVPVDGAYELSGHLLERQARQDESRAGHTGEWDGRWEMAVVERGQRPAEAREALRRSAHALRLAELREGVWLRPANLDARRSPGDREVVAAQCRTFTAHADEDPGALAAGLWDLEGWATEAERLRTDMTAWVDALERGEQAALAPGFVVAAAVLRHFQADPLLPPELLPARWPGDSLRAEFDRYDDAFRLVWRAWYRSAVA